MEPLTPRQIEIARKVASGASYKRIAAELGITVPTVQDHIASACERLPPRPGIGSPRMRLVLFILESQGF